jgi:hypothetical protein
MQKICDTFVGFAIGIAIGDRMRAGTGTRFQVAWWNPSSSDNRIRPAKYTVDEGWGAQVGYFALLAA